MRRAILSVVLAVIVISPSLIAQQQAAPPPVLPDMSAPFQINWIVPIDANSVNQMILIVQSQVKLGRKNFIFLISSQGGEVLSGLTAYNFLHGLNVNITTFNMGQVDSAANLVFCAGDHRYALPTSRFLLHSSFMLMPPGMMLNAEFLDGQYQQVQSMNRLIVDVLNSTTHNKHTAEIEAAVRGQKILTPADAKQWGLIDAERDGYVTPNAVIATITPTIVPASNPAIPLASVTK
jgi:ATP-dependent protease ClpP protease subunit